MKSGTHLTQELRRYVPSILAAIPAHLTIDVDQEEQGRQVWGQYTLRTELEYRVKCKSHSFGRCETSWTGHFSIDTNMLTSTLICAYCIAL